MKAPEPSKPARLALIPARGGSKRIPGKNIRDFLGRPILHYSILAAVASGLFDEIMVSTDSNDVAAKAQQAGATTPFMRSEKTSGDHATLAEVVREVLQNFQAGGRRFDQVCCILPTAPFVTSGDLNASYQAFFEGRFDALFPVVRFSYPILRALRMTHGRVSMIWPEYESTRSQDLEPAFHDAGLFYWLETAPFLETGRIFSENAGAWEIDEQRAQDIDTEEDWKLAELKFQVLNHLKP